MFLTFSKCLGLDNDLVFAVGGGHTVITLDDAAMGLHLGGFIIGDVAFLRLSGLPRFVIVVFQPFPDFGYSFVQGRNKLVFAFLDFGFGLVLIFFLMFLQNVFDGHFHPGGLLFKVGFRAAPF